LKKRKQVVEKVVKVFNPYLMTGTAHEDGGIKVFKVGIWRVVKLFWKGGVNIHDLVKYGLFKEEDIYTAYQWITSTGIVVAITYISLYH
jgi:hypothetical protein